MTGYGKNAGLPYDEYMITGVDFVPIWWDTETTGPSAALGTEGKGVWWYLDDAKRYKAGDYPKQQFSWFDTTGAVTGFDAYPDQPLVLVTGVHHLSGHHRRATRCRRAHHDRRPVRRHRARRRGPDMDLDELTWLPAWQIRELIGKQEVSPVEVTNHFLDRIDALDPTLKAFKHLDADGAREQASARREGDATR